MNTRRNTGMKKGKHFNLVNIRWEDNGGRIAVFEQGDIRNRDETKLSGQFRKTSASKCQLSSIKKGVILAEVGTVTRETDASTKKNIISRFR